MAKTRERGQKVEKTFAVFAMLQSNFAAVPEPAQWQEWSEWSKCSCVEGRKGEGIKRRTRSCSDPTSGSNQGCLGRSTEEKSCDEGECTGSSDMAICCQQGGALEVRSVNSH